MPPRAPPSDSGRGRSGERGNGRDGERGGGRGGGNWGGRGHGRGGPVVGLTEALSEVGAVAVAVVGLSRPVEFLTPLSHNCLLAERVLIPLTTFRQSASSAGNTGTPGG